MGEEGEASREGFQKTRQEEASRGGVKEEAPMKVVKERRQGGVSRGESLRGGINGRRQGEPSRGRLKGRHDGAASR